MAGRYVGRLPRKCDQKISVPPCFVAICSQKQPFCGTLGVWRSCAQHAGVVRALVRGKFSDRQRAWGAFVLKTEHQRMRAAKPEPAVISGYLPGRPGAFGCGFSRCSGR